MMTAATMAPKGFCIRQICLYGGPVQAVIPGHDQTASAILGERSETHERELTATRPPGLGCGSGNRTDTAAAEGRLQCATWFWPCWPRADWQWRAARRPGPSAPAIPSA